MSYHFDSPLAKLIFDKGGTSSIVQTVTVTEGCGGCAIGEWREHGRDLIKCGDAPGTMILIIAAK